MNGLRRLTLKCDASVEYTAGTHIQSLLRLGYMSLYELHRNILRGRLFFIVSTHISQISNVVLISESLNLNLWGAHRIRDHTH